MLVGLRCAGEIIDAHFKLINKAIQQKISDKEVTWTASIGSPEGFNSYLWVQLAWRQLPIALTSSNYFSINFVCRVAKCLALLITSV